MSEQPLSRSKSIKPTYSKLRPQSIVIINERNRDLEYARLKLDQLQLTEEPIELDDDNNNLNPELSLLESTLPKHSSIFNQSRLNPNKLLLKPKLLPTSARIKHAIKLIKANLHTHQPTNINLMWSDERLILDLGSLYIKMGFSNLVKPDIIGVYQTKLNLNEIVEKNYGLYTPNFNELMYSIGGEKYMEQILVKLFQGLFNPHLPNACNRRRVVILENPLMADAFKNLIIKVLFERFMASGITFIPNQLASLLSTGKSDGLVIDVGNNETCIMAIVDGRPLDNFIMTSSLAGKSVTLHLKQLLLNYATIQPSIRQFLSQPKVRTSRSKSEPVNESKGLILIEDMLNLKLLEEIKIRLLMVHPHRQNLNYSIDELEEYGQLHTQCKSITFPFQYKNQSLDLLIPGWLRDFTYNQLFNPTFYPDLPTPYQLTLDLILKLPMELKSILSSNILLTGGTTQSPGFLYRFQVELLQLININKKYKSLQPLIPKFKFNNNNNQSNIFMKNQMAWIGAKVATDIKALNDHITKDQFIEKENQI